MLKPEAKSGPDDLATASDEGSLAPLFWAMWMRVYAWRLALGLAGLMLAAYRRDGLLTLLAGGFLLQPIGGALALSDLSPGVKRMGRGLVKAGRVAFFLLCAAVLLRGSISGVKP